MQQDQHINAELVAKYFKFYRQELKNNSVVRFSLENQRVKGFTTKHFITLTKIAKILIKYKINIDHFMSFYVNELKRTEYDIDNDFLSAYIFKQYAEWKQELLKQRHIYSLYIKSAKFIACECIKHGFLSAKDFIRFIISEKTVSHYFVSGKISLHYFAAIPNFKKIILKLDHFSRDEFKRVYDRFEMYNAEINCATLKLKNQKANPIQLTDELIIKYKTK
jgi:hypothetical protein